MSRLQTTFPSVHPEWRSSVWSFGVMYLAAAHIVFVEYFAGGTEMFTTWSQPWRVCVQLYKATGDGQVWKLLVNRSSGNQPAPAVQVCEYNFPSFLLHMNHFITPSLHPSVLSYFDHLTAWQLLLPVFAVVCSICWAAKIFIFLKSTVWRVVFTVSYCLTVLLVQICSMEHCVTFISLSLLFFIYLIKALIPKMSMLTVTTDAQCTEIHFHT